ncbi:hypothetical protein NE237_023563 [Protea cynaroides]|uniref:Uncharacterized protein n=1 Tax=Protea cynaroides TaxID=273540 RepID=A0A9Q0HHB9_9MAGN|nr:hypothetical protein NE237_023563 [Protea cynaroides]
MPFALYQSCLRFKFKSQLLWLCFSFQAKRRTTATLNKEADRVCYRAFLLPTKDTAVSGFQKLQEIFEIFSDCKYLVTVLPGGGSALGATEFLGKEAGDVLSFEKE